MTSIHTSRPIHSASGRLTGSFQSQLEVLGSSSFCHQHPGIWISASSGFSSNSFVQGASYQQPLFFPREECCTLPSSLRHVAQRNNSGGQGSIFPGFYSRLFLVAMKTGGWRPVIDLSFLNLYLDFPTFRMETTQSIRNSLEVGQWMHTSTFPWLIRFTNCSGFKFWASYTSLWQCLLA